MASQDQLNQLNEILQSMSTSQLAGLLDQVVEVRKTRPCRFLELPPKLRNTIYHMTIDPEVIESHIRLSKTPPLLLVNRQISQEFFSLYYSPEYMTLELYYGPRKGWKSETTSKMLLIGRVFETGFSTDGQFIDIESLKSKVERCHHLYEEFCISKDLEMTDMSLDGVFRFHGLPEDRGLWCTYHTGARIGWERKVTAVLLSSCGKDDWGSNHDLEV